MGHVFTIGHSTHSIAAFIRLLELHAITAVADVRSVPSSRFTPQFNRKALRRSLNDVHVSYVFLGKELGARSPDPGKYVDGVVQYDRLARSSEFGEGLHRIMDGMDRERIAVMCTEQEPLDCHRTVLVARELCVREVGVDHIHADGRLESQDQAMHRLMAGFGLDQPELFRTEAELLGEALQRQEQRIAYVDQKLAQS